MSRRRLKTDDWAGRRGHVRVGSFRTTPLGLWDQAMDAQAVSHGAGFFCM